MTEVNILRGKTIKSGDTKPSLRLKLLEDERPFNLSGYNITIAIKETTEGTVIVNSAATIEDASRGIVTYSWNNGETDTASTYDLEVVASDGTDEITFPNRGTQRLHIQERIV